MALIFVNFSFPSVTENFLLKIAFYLLNVNKKYFSDRNLISMFQSNGNVTYTMYKYYDNADLQMYIH